VLLSLYLLENSANKITVAELPLLIYRCRTIVVEKNTFDSVYTASAVDPIDVLGLMLNILPLMLVRY